MEVLLTLLFIVLFIVIVVKNKKLKDILYTDSSTGKISHVKFEMYAEELMAMAEPEEYLLVSMDTDNFKYINDIYGYDKGNQVLKILAEYLEKILPREKVLSARISADNFVFITRTEYKDRILKAFNDNVKLDEAIRRVLDQDYNISLSVGIYVIGDTSKHLSAMMDCANIAKKMKKGKIGNSISEYTEEMNQKMELKKKITVSKEAALIREEFIPWLQPKFSLLSGKLIGAEVLVRWEHPHLGRLQPLTFIPLFEENGFIEKLDMYMFEHTCSMIQQWHQKGVLTIPKVSVNMSRVTLNRENLVKELNAITGKYELNTACLEIEITEGILEKNPDKIIRIINELKAVGFCVSIDDFGSGYSSLSILKDMPADIIKIDKEFLSTIFDSSKGKKIIYSVIHMSKELQLETVAEGIETKEQAEFLKEMGCDIAQGYYFARPMKPDCFKDLLPCS